MPAPSGWVTRASILITLLGLAAGCAGRTSTEPTPDTAPAPISIEVEATHVLRGYVRIDWRVLGGQGLDFEVQRRHATQPWKHRATLSPDGTGRMTLEDTAVSSGEPYSYRVQAVDRGDPEFAGTVAVTVP
jgi:hypothetical protein